MTDVDIIIKFLERNCKVSTNNENFILIDKSNNKVYGTHDLSGFLILTLLEIFGTNDKSFMSVISYTFDDWFDDKKAKVAKQITDIFDSMMPSISSHKTLMRILNKYSLEDNKTINKNITTEFIKNYFNDYFINKIMKKLIKTHIQNFDLELGSLRFVGDFFKKYPDQTPFIDDYIMKELNSWYSENALNNIVKDFLCELVVTLGRNNWVITRIGHGPIELQFLNNHFPRENPAQIKKINNLFAKWKEDAIIDASEREMKKNAF